MITVKTMLTHLAEPENILRGVRQVLHRIDPPFLTVEQGYLAAVEKLRVAFGDLDSPSVAAYVAAEEKKIGAELLYVGWLGFMQNLECFKNPVNALFLKLDYEQLHREDRMDSISTVRKMQKVIDAFHKEVCGSDDEMRTVMNGITDYICYLKTTGYKLAHYFGFAFADQFLEYVIPEYKSDRMITMQYESELSRYLKMDLKQLI